MSVDPKDVAWRLLDEDFNRGNLDVLAKLIHPEVLYHTPDGEIRGLDGVRQLVMARSR
jgi:SnoaL-like domain